MTYIPEIRSNPTNKIALTGSQVEGMPGRELLDSGREEIDGRVMPVGAQVVRYDFSVHADRDGLLYLLSEYRNDRIFVNHGDRCETFAEELVDREFDASAPGLGDEVTV